MSQRKKKIIERLQSTSQSAGKQQATSKRAKEAAAALTKSAAAAGGFDDMTTQIRQNEYLRTMHAAPQRDDEYLKMLRQTIKANQAAPDYIRQVRKNAALNAPTSYQPLLDGSVTSKAMDIYHAGQPASQRTIEVMSGNAWDLTDQQMQDVLTGDTLLDGTSAWDYFTNDLFTGNSREALERGVADNAAILEMGRNVGRFDRSSFLTPATMNLPSTDYLNQMTGYYQQLIDNRNAVWNTEANLRWVNEVGSQTENDTLVWIGYVDRMVEEEPELYGGQDGRYNALLDMVNSGYGPGGLRTNNPANSDAIIDGFLIDMLKMNHIINGHDLATFDEQTALEEFRALPEDQFYQTFNYLFTTFGKVTWGQPYALLDLHDMEEGRLPYMQRELENREEFQSITVGLHKEMVASGFTITPEEMAAVEVEVNEIFNEGFWGWADGTNFGYLMTPEEKMTYAYLKQQDPSGEEAKEYIYLLADTHLYARRAQANVAENRLYATDPLFAVPTFAGTVASTVIDVPLALVKGAHAMSGDDHGGAPWHDMTLYRETSRGAQGDAIEEAGGETWGPILRAGYDTVSGVADFGAMALIGTAIGGPTYGPQVTGLLMGASAASADLTATADTDMPGWARVARAGAVFGAEMLTERYSIDALLSDPTNTIEYIMRNMLTEGTEEIASEVLNQGIDFATAIFTGKTPELIQRYDQYVAEGREDAFTAVLAEAVGDAIYSGLIGAAVGGTISLPSAGSSYTANRNAGRQVQQAGGTDNLLQLGLAMGEGTQSHQQAVQISQQMTGSQGKARISPAQLGQLYRTMLSETNEEYQDDVRQMAVEAIGDAIADKYDTLDLVDEMEEDYTNDELGEAILQAGETGRDPGGRIGRFIRNHRVTAEILNEFIGGEAGWTQDLDARRADATAELAGRLGKLAETVTPAAQSTETAPTTAAVEDETTPAVQSMTRRNSTRELLSRSIVMKADDGQEVQGELVRVERSKDGLQLIIDRGGEKTKAALEDVAQVSGAGVARVLAYAQERAEISAEEINEMVNLLMDSGEGAIKSAELISAYETGVNAGYEGVTELAEIIAGATKDAGKAAKAVQAAMEAGFRQGMQQAQQAEQQRTAPRRHTLLNRRAVAYMGEVEADFDGTDTGVRQSMDSVRGSLTEQQRAAADAIGQIAKAVGVNVVMYRTAAQKGQAVTAANGFYEAATNTIFVDLNSGMNRGGEGIVNYTIMQTFGHELTHFIERNSADGYATLRQLVKDTLGKQGKSYMELVVDRARTSQHAKTRAQAEAEVIADACEMMLRDSKAIQQLAQRDMTLAAKIRGFVASFVRRIREAFAGLTAGSREAALISEVQDGVMTYMDGLQAAWDKALIEASGNLRSASEAAQQAAQQAVQVRVSQTVPQATAQAMAAEVAAEAVAVVEARSEDIAKALQDTPEAAEEVRTQATQAAARAAQEVASDVYQGADEAMQQGLQEAAEAAAAAAVEAQVLEKTVEEAQRQYSYAGRRSRTAERTMLDEAMDMFVDGEDMETIRQKTGWFKGMEGVWRYEIDDSEAEIHDVATTRMHTLPELLDHPTLYKAYPFLEDVHIQFADLREGVRGGAVKGTIYLSNQVYTDGQAITGDKADLMNTILHETQHLIQREEGFAKGSNRDYWQRQIDMGFAVSKNESAIKAAQKTLSDFVYKQNVDMRIALDKYGKLRKERNDAELKMLEADTVEEAEDARDELARLQNEIDILREKANKYSKDQNSDPFWTYDMFAGAIERATAADRPLNSRELYEKTAGEIEARDVSNRRGMDAEQRRSNKPDLQDDAVFVESWLGRQYSERKGYLLTPAEYGRFMRNWEGRRYNKYAKRNNGGILVDMGKLLVYTDRRGKPQHVLEVLTDDLWTDNEIVKRAALLEKEGYDVDEQQEILESFFATGSFRFRVPGDFGGDRGEKTNRGRNDFGKIRGEDRKKQSSEGTSAEDEVKQFSERRHRTPTIRQAVSRMKVDERMNETEKLLLGRYKADVAEYERLQGEIDQLVEAMQGEQTPEQATANKNRMGVLKSQQRRVGSRLRKAEGSEGFARLMRTGTQMVHALARNESLEDVAFDLEQRIGQVAYDLEVLNRGVDRTLENNIRRVMAGLFDQEAVRKAAQGLKAQFGSSMSVRTIGDRLMAMSVSNISGEKPDGMDLVEQAKAFAKELRASGSVDVTGTLENLREALPTIVINESVRKELASRGITVPEYRRVVGRVAKVVFERNGNSGDLLAQMETDAYYGRGGILGAYFGDVVNDADALGKLYDIVSKAMDQAGQLYEGADGEEMLLSDMAGVLQAMLDARLLDAGTDTITSINKVLGENSEAQQRLVSRMTKLSRSATEASKLASRVENALSGISIGGKEVMEYYRRLEEQRRLMDEQDALARMKNEMKGQMADWYREKELREENNRQRGAIRRLVGMMDRRIRKETDQRNIPEGLKPLVQEMVQIFANANDTMHMLPAREIDEILRVYRALAKADAKAGRAMDVLLQEDMAENLAMLREDIAAYSEITREGGVTEMLSQQNEILTAMHDIVSQVWKATQDANTLFLDGKEERLSAIGAEMGAQLEAMDDYSIRDNALGKLGQLANRELRLNNTTPVYFFRQMGVDVMKRLNDALLSAQGRHARMHDEAKQRIAQIQAKHDYWGWRNNDPLELTTWQGVTQESMGVKHKHRVTLTPDEALSIWAIWKREKASSDLYNSTHLAKGGFVFASGTRTVDGRTYTDKLPHKISEKDIQAIDNWLTPEMKAYADEMVEYMSTDMAEVGNRTSMRLYGIRKFREGYYFPMRVAREQLAQKSDAGAKGEVDSNRIAHFSATKRRISEAKKPLAIDSFTAVAADHVEKMLMYDNFAEPIEAFNKVLNHVYATGEDEGENVSPQSRMTLRALVEQKLGKDATAYLERYLADVNGGPQVDAMEKGFFARGMTAYKKAAVVGSASVVLQQPTSIVRAAMHIDPKYFTPWGAKDTNTELLKEWGQLRKYSGTALIKERGGFDMTGKRTLAKDLEGIPEDEMTKAQRVAAAFGIGTRKGVKAEIAKRQWDEALGWAAQKADQIAWVAIWRATKKEVAANNKGMDTSSAEFLQMAADRFDEVINLTQVYDSTLVRSANMRSKSAWMKMFTAFMAEPTLTANMLMDAAKTGNWKTIAKAAAVFAVSNVATAAAAALAKAGRDDDEDKPWMEKYLASVWDQLGGWGGSMNPLALFPGLRDVMSLLDGYDLERSDMSLLSTLFDEGGKLLSGAYADDPLRGVENIAGAIGNMFGVPVKNVSRDLRAVWNTATGLINPPREVSGRMLVHDAKKGLTPRGMEKLIPWLDTTNGAYDRRVFNAMKRGDEKEVAALKEFMGLQGRSDTAINTGVKNVVKEEVAQGRMTDAEAKEFLLANGLVKDEKGAFETIDRWEEGSESYSAYNGMRAAIARGDIEAAEAEMDELMANGWTETEVRTQARTQANQAYMAGLLTKEQVMQLHKRDDWDENKWYWHFEELDYGKANGGDTSGWRKYGAFFEAVDTSKNLRGVAANYLNHGVTNSTLKGQLRDNYRDEYRTLSKTNRREFANLRARLVNALVAIGYPRDEAMKYLDSWLED